ncbi:MAG TPA: DNA replication and repair protein RecF [Thermoleophilia bacterium]|nr:DNA replication and repair protein RecF [Thermoleophilia bacterium]HQJ97078.1 DNA replication and repair protein RecF [Thermoleophilia bacterium]
MFLSEVRLVNFRSYCDASVVFGRGLNVVVGPNASGKTNLLEGACFALRGSSPRTRREEKLVAWGRRFTRVSVRMDGVGDRPHTMEVGYSPGEGKRVRWDGLETTALHDLRGRCQAFIFVPESLLLVKGGPARRRAHIDAYAATVETPYAATVRDLQVALRQRNAQLANVRAGAPPATLDPWDAQFARSAIALGRRRSAVVRALGARFAEVAAALAPDGGRFALELVSQLARMDYDESALLERLRARRAADVQRGLTDVGPQRDDLRFVELSETPEGAAGEACRAARGAETAAACGPVGPPPGGRDLRLFGSQGEQRAAVLALLLAEHALAAERTGETGTLFLDDVMSELDDARRRLLVAMLADAGQAIVTTTNLHYFTDEELAAATVIDLPLANGGVSLANDGTGDADVTKDGAGGA